MVAYLLLVTALGALAASDGPPGTPGRTEMSAARTQAPVPRTQASPTDLHRLPPIYGMTHRWSAAAERIQRAHHQVVGACMSRLGFAYPPTPPPSTSRSEDPWPFPFGFETTDQLQPRPAQPAPAETPRGEAFERALFGDPDHRVTARGAKLTVNRPATGCLAEADGRLQGEMRIRSMQLSILLYEAETTALQLLDADAAFRGATEQWRRCVQRAGFPVRDPRDLLRKSSAQPDPAAAQADVRCKRSTGYLTTAYDRLARIQQRLLDKDPSLARDWARIQARQDSVARDVLP
ncbi:hypothetical protein [Streptomyces sp. NBC_00259]|uniref:hypothetical protein n=1 Tax=Streptomyces sp. NBC_00259 TaxID=2903643 RepID=UPI002E286F86|nr:hypothetical protein [Streptomyces sp. NBC_00259]